jgi:hypothetical protein
MAHYICFENELDELSKMLVVSHFFDMLYRSSYISQDMYIFKSGIFVGERPVG